jgi:hypothetical protein
MDISTIKRHGRYILLGNKKTAEEGFSGNLPTLIIRENGNLIHSYRGSSLYFSKKLTEEDKDYLVALSS